MMTVLIQIDGREAIPVRAIPLLTHWQTMTPDALAQALAGDEHYFRFENMRAYRFDDGQALPKSWWQSNVVRPLLALSDTIRASQISHETGLQEVHTESLKKLPAGVYVWRDEFAQTHQWHYSKTTLPLDCDGNDLQLTDAEAARLTAEHQERITLDFSTFIDAATHALVMQGFGVHPTDIEPEQSAPVADASDGPVPLTKAPAWNLKRPTRFQGYGKPLYDFLKAAHIAGKPKPTARDLLDVWKIKPPPDVFEVTDNGLKYYDAKGNTKPADLDAIRKAIGRMTR